MATRAVAGSKQVGLGSIPVSQVTASDINAAIRGARAQEHFDVDAVTVTDDVGKPRRVKIR
jgi:hypothetical protein